MFIDLRYIKHSGEHFACSHLMPHHAVRWVLLFPVQTLSDLPRA